MHRLCLTVVKLIRLTFLELLWEHTSNGNHVFGKGGREAKQEHGKREGGWFPGVVLPSPPEREQCDEAAFHQCLLFASESGKDGVNLLVHVLLRIARIPEAAIVDALMRTTANIM